MGSMEGWEAVMAVFQVLAIVAVLCLAASIATYVLHSVALYRGLCACGYVDAWLAWIPVAREYALADCAVHGMRTVDVGGVPVPGWVFRFYWALCYVLAIIPYAGWILSAALRVFVEGPCYAAMYGVVDGRDPREGRLVGYLSSLIPIIAIVKLWKAGRPRDAY